MAKKKVAPIVGNEEAENPAPASEGGLGKVGKPKRIRRSKADILIDKLQKFYGGIESAEVKDLFEKAVGAITALDGEAQRAKKKEKSFSIKRIARFRSKEELQAMMEQLQEAIEAKED